MFSIWDSARRSDDELALRPGRPGQRTATVPGVRHRVERRHGAVVWASLAIWRTVTLGTVQFAVLVFFGVLNLAVVSRVIFPGGRAT